MEKNDSDIDKDNKNEIKPLKEVIKESHAFDHPEDDDHVKIRYSARIEHTEKPFETKDLSFQVGCSFIPIGIHMSVKMMSLGEISSFIIHPNLIYTNLSESNKSDPIKIPIPKENLIYEIELYHWKRSITLDGCVSKIKTIQIGNKKFPSKTYDNKCIVSFKSENENSLIKPGNDVEIVLGSTNDNVFRGLEIALWSMNEKEKSLFTIAGEYLLPKNQTTKHDRSNSENIEIFLSSMTIDIPETFEKKREIVRLFTKRGIKFREEKQFIEAIEQFDRAGLVLSEIQFEANEHVMKLSLEATLFVNKNMSLMEMEEYKMIIDNSNTILSKYPKFLDALWIRGRAQGKMGLLEDAKKDFEAILDICNEEEVQWGHRKRKMKELSNQLKLAYETASNRLNKSKKILQHISKTKNIDPAEIEQNTKELNKATHIANGLQKQIEELRKRKEKEEQEFEKTQKADQTLRRSVEIELSKLDVPILYDYFIHQNQNILGSSLIFDHQSDQDVSIVKKFIKEHLPGFLEIRSGEVWDSFGNRSYYFQTLIVNKNMPTLSKSSSIVLYESVSAVIEIVPTLSKEYLVTLESKLALVNAMNRDTNEYQNDEDLLPIKMIVAIRCDDLSLNGIKSITEEKNVIDAVYILDEGIVYTSSKPLPTKKSLSEAGKGIALKYLWFTLSSLPERKHFCPEEYIQGHWP